MQKDWQTEINQNFAELKEREKVGMLCIVNNVIVLVGCRACLYGNIYLKGDASPLNSKCTGMIIQGEALKQT